VRYSEILGLYENFKPAYDLTDEIKNGWKQFIPVDSFIDLLSSFLEALESSDPRTKRSIWLQGKYGVGKSHATSVVKHLLWDPWEDIEDFVDQLGNVKPQLQKKLENFRHRNRVFPVVLKGSGSINDGLSFKWAIQNAVKKALNQEGLDITPLTEFEQYKRHVLEQEKYGHDWDVFLNEKPQLRAMVGNRDGLITALEHGNVEVLKAFRKALGDVLLPTADIETWLEEVVKELKAQDVATSMAIYWDEFTSVLDIQRRAPEILTLLQNIAEKTFSSDIYLFVVSHRDPEQIAYTEDEKKVLDRFISKTYRMEEITTYDIIAHAIKKKDPEQWKILRDQCLRNTSITNLILRLTSTDGADIKRIVSDVFPIHPYTAFLAAKLADHVGSAERTIFSFLYDEEKGFNGFMKEYPKEFHGGTEYFLTAPTLWDFFVEEFENSESEKMRSILQKFTQYKDDLDNRGSAYGAVFRVILLLNVLYTFVGGSSAMAGVNLLLPSEENIRGAFAGTTLEEAVADVLGYLVDREIFDLTADGLYEVAVSNLPEDEVKRKKVEFGKKYEDVSKLIKEYDDLYNNLLSGLRKNVLRELDIGIFGANSRNYEVKKVLREDFKKPYALKVAIFVGRSEDELRNIESVIDEIMKTPQESNPHSVVFVVARNTLGEKEFDKFITYKAKSAVAREHGYESAIENEKWARKFAENFASSIEKGTAMVFTKQGKQNVSFSSLSTVLNNHSKDIFEFGLENIEDLTQNKNIWEKKRAEKLAQIFCAAQSYEDLVQRTRNNARYNMIMAMFRTNGEYIVDNKLFLKKDLTDGDHPLVKICKEVERALENNRGSTFSLRAVLGFLAYEPYGLYANEVNTAALAFALRPYINKIFQANSGIKITPDQMGSKVVKLLDSFDNGGVASDELRVRLGSEEESSLVSLLTKLFGLQENENLTNVRWGVRKWFTEKARVPVWVLKYVDELKGLDNVKENTTNFIVTVIDKLVSSPDSELNQESISSFYKLLQRFEPFLTRALDIEKLNRAFEEWLQQQDDVATVLPDDIPSVKEYLTRNMQEQVALWKEDKLRLQLQKWGQEKEASETEKQLAKIIGKIFRLEEDLPEVGTTVKAVRQKINNEVGYPIWLFKYFYNDEDFSDAVMALNTLVVSSEGSGAMFDYGKYVNLLRGKEDVLASNFGSVVGSKALSIWAQRCNCDTTANVGQDLVRLAGGEVWKITEDQLREVITIKDFLLTAARLFGLESVSNMTDLSSGIQEWLDRVGYPYWFFEKIAQDSNLRSLLSDIADVVRSAGSKQDAEHLGNLAKRIKASEPQLKELLTPESASLYMKIMLEESFSLYDLDDATVRQLLREVRQVLKDTDFYWNEEKFNEQLKRRIDVLKGEQKKHKLRETIESGSHDLKEIMLRLIEEYPEVCEWLVRELGLGE